jgi:hypothetical protein
MDPRLKNYNDNISKNWNETSTKNNSELLFALAANPKGRVLMFWDNTRGNESMIDYLKQVVKMLEENKDKSFKKPLI